MNTKEEALAKWNKILFNDLVKPVLKRAAKRNKRAEKDQARRYKELEEARQARLDRHARFITDQTK